MTRNVHGFAGVLTHFANIPCAMIKRLFTRIWYATTAIPPLRAENLLPIVAMLIGWVWLLQLGIAEGQAFVTVVVMAEAYAIWRNLPAAADSLDKVNNARPKHLYWPVAIIVALSALQIGLNSPLFTQRVLTGFCIFFLIIMLLGMRRERDLLERVVPNSAHRGQAVERVSLLRINAIAAAMVILVNEILIASETLVVWITVMPLFAVFLHGFYWFMLLLVLPPEPKPPSNFVNER